MIVSRPSPTVALRASGIPSRHKVGLPLRVAILSFVFAIELIALSGWIDTSTLLGKPGLLGMIEDLGKQTLQAIIAFSALFLTFGYLRSKGSLERISTEVAEVPIKWILLLGHLGAMLAVAWLTSILFGANPSAATGNLVAGSWLAAGILGICLAAFAVVPPASWFNLLRSTGSAWAYASAATFVALELVKRSGRLWEPAIGVTFILVRTLLRPFLSDLVADPATATIGSHRFQASIGWGCSGVEGLGLIAVFSVAWLWFFRRELRFPQALLLIPSGVCLLWLLNAVRIAALILIGNAGAPAVAVGGFHSEAGWIAFNAVALAFSLAAQRVRWFTLQPRVSAPREAAAENPTAAYLAPFLVIMAAAMIGRASSSTFEWLYPLRFVAAAAVIWMFRRKYASLNWSFGWLSPVVGILVFALWMGLDRLSGIAPDNSLGANLAGLPTAGRITWIVFRTLAATVTVPIAEELAFRGFLMRRFISADFESVGPRVFKVLAVLLSSFAFGALHGDRWIAGTLAGLLYASVVLWRGRIGDAVVAHAVTNALIAASVLIGGSWYLW